MKSKSRIAIILLIAALILSACLRDTGDNETDPKIETPEEIETPDTDETEPDETDGPVETPEETDDETDPPKETDPEPEPPETNVTASITDDGTGRVHTISLDRSRVVITVGLSDMPWVTMLPENAADKSEIWKSSDESIATVDRYGRIMGISTGECTVSVASGARPELVAEIRVTVHAKKIVTEPTYFDGIMIANKTYALPDSYNPGIDADAYRALNEMISAASEDGIGLFMISGFRSYETQKTLYNNYVARDGKVEADRYSARPGHSEHQTGLAFDLNSLEQSFGETKEGKWLAQHCHEYGFIIRYPHDKEEITGYMYEPWHVRYLGKDKARDVKESGLCLEEYLGINSVYEN